MPQKLASLKGRTFLLGVGAQKAGTTWLYYYLQKHPEVHMSRIKEMHFFGNRHATDAWPINTFRKRLHRLEERAKAENPQNPKAFMALRERIRMQGNISAYRRFFRKRVQDAQIFGEITPAYSKLDVDELQFISDQFPKTKVIFLMRNPVDRLWSQMRFSEDFETGEDLEARIHTVIHKPVYAERIDYARTIRNLRQVFRPEQLHFEFYEHLFSDAAVNRLCDFLHIEPMPAAFEKRRNVSPKAPLSPLLRPKVVAELREQYDFVMQEFGDQVPRKWLDDLA